MKRVRRVGPLTLLVSASAVLAWAASCGSKQPAPARVTGLLCEAHAGMPASGRKAWATVDEGGAGRARAQDELGAFRLWLEREGARVSVGVDDLHGGEPIWRMDFARAVFDRDAIAMQGFYALHVLRHPHTAEVLQVRCRRRHAAAGTQADGS